MYEWQPGLVEEYSDGKAIASSPADVDRLYLRHHLLLCACLIKALPITMYDCITQLERMSPTMVTGKRIENHDAHGQISFREKTFSLYSFWQLSPYAEIDTYLLA